MLKSEPLRLLVVFLIAVGLYVLYRHFVLDTPVQHFNSEMNEMVGGYSPTVDDVQGLKSLPNKVNLNKNVLEPPQPSNNTYELSNNVLLTEGNVPGAFPADELTAHDLLPTNNSHWEASNPTLPGHLNDKNFCDSGHHYGINTVGSSLRNANVQLRSDPVIKKQAVGPWHQSTIEPDTNRRHFEVGEI